KLEVRPQVRHVGVVLLRRLGLRLGLELLDVVETLTFGEPLCRLLFAHKWARSKPCALCNPARPRRRIPRGVRLRTGHRTDPAYSLRSASIGSRRAARRAGSQHATRPTTASTSATATNVVGSVGRTS